MVAVLAELDLGARFPVCTFLLFSASISAAIICLIFFLKLFASHFYQFRQLIFFIFFVALLNVLVLVFLLVNSCFFFFSLN